MLVPAVVSIELGRHLLRPGSKLQTNGLDHVLIQSLSSFGEHDVVFDLNMLLIEITKTICRRQKLAVLVFAQPLSEIRDRLSVSASSRN